MSISVFELEKAADGSTEKKSKQTFGPEKTASVLDIEKQADTVINNGQPQKPTMLRRVAGTVAKGALLAGGAIGGAKVLSAARSGTLRSAWNAGAGQGVGGATRGALNAVRGARVRGAWN